MIARELEQALHPFVFGVLCFIVGVGIYIAGLVIAYIVQCHLRLNIVIHQQPCAIEGKAIIASIHKVIRL